MMFRLVSMLRCTRACVAVFLCRGKAGKAISIDVCMYVRIYRVGPCHHRQRRCSEQKARRLLRRRLRFKGCRRCRRRRRRRQTAEGRGRDNCFRASS